MKTDLYFKPGRLMTLAAAVVAFAALPAVASAHPTVYTSQARTLPSPFTYGGPGGVGLNSVNRYVVVNHGYVGVFTESNGVSTRGVLDYKFVPGAYRTALRADSVDGGDGVFLDEAGTGAQIHATCTGVPALANTANVLAWQGSDPFYGYIPFQPNSAGFEDNPADWTDDVQTLTGVDLAGISDTSTDAGSPLALACSGIGGTLKAPDTLTTTGAAFASGNISDAVTPLNTQLEQLGTTNDGLQTANSTLVTEKNSLQTIVDGLNGEKTALSSQLGTAKSATKTAKSRLSKAQKQVKQLKKQVAKLKKQLRKRSR